MSIYKIRTIITIFIFTICILSIIFTTGCCKLGSDFTNSFQKNEVEEKNSSLDEDQISDYNESNPSHFPHWIVTIGGDGRDYAPSLTTVKDGYVLVGMTTSYGLGSGNSNLDGLHDLMAVRLDKKGNILWCKTIGGPQDERGSFSCTPTSDDGYLLTGTTSSFGSGGSDIFVIKLNPKGSLDWAKAIGGNGLETGKTTLETENGYITVGDTNSLGAGQRDLLVVNYDHFGNIIWSYAIGGTDEDKGSGISEINGSYMIGGTIWSYGSGGADACLIKINSDGNIIWSKAIGGTKDEGVNWDGVRVLDDGGFVLGEGTSSYGAKNQAICCMRLKPDCTPIWALLIDGPGDDAGWAMSMVDDGYIVGGKYNITQNGGDVIFLKTDKGGNFLWARKFGGAGLDEIEEIVQSDDGFVMSGITRINESNGDFLIAKVNGEGFIGGENDPIEEFSPASISNIDPIVTDFSPIKTDASSKIKIIPVTPSVDTPDININTITGY